MVYTDDALAYVGLRRPHTTVKHSAKEYVDGMAHTNGMESFWAMLKRGYQGIYHQFSAKHLHRYVGEFEGRHNARPMDTAEQMAEIVRGMFGKRLRYQDLIGPGANAAERSVGISLMTASNFRNRAKSNTYSLSGLRRLNRANGWMAR